MGKAARVVSESKASLTPSQGKREKEVGGGILNYIDILLKKGSARLLGSP